MSRTKREEQRLLSKDEYELVSQTRRPTLQELSEGDLAATVTRLRDRRDRARDIASRQRRELRGKAAPSGAKPATGDEGSGAKRDLLAAALKRANKEATRRRATSARRDLVANAQNALSSRKAADKKAPKRPKSRTADTGMEPTPNTKIAPSGAFDEAGHRPVLERSRKVR